MIDTLHNSTQHFISCCNLSSVTLMCEQGGHAKTFLPWPGYLKANFNATISPTFLVGCLSSTGLTGGKMSTSGYCWPGFGLYCTSYYAVISSGLDSKHNTLLRAWPRASWCKWKNSYWPQWSLVWCLNKLKDITTIYLKIVMLLRPYNVSRGEKHSNLKINFQLSVKDPMKSCHW